LPEFQSLGRGGNRLPPRGVRRCLLNMPARNPSHLRSALTYILGTGVVVGCLLRGSVAVPSITPYPAIDLGPLPVDLINAALGTELEPGHARLSRTAHRHIATDHPADYPVCIAELAAAIARPTFIGQAPGHSRNFEMIRRISRPDGSVVLVAIGLQPDEHGDYSVRTCYLLEAGKVEARRRQGRLRLVIPG
jgi:hypothetical protein